jgi:hypothetical protein
MKTGLINRLSLQGVTDVANAMQSAGLAAVAA